MPYTYRKVGDEYCVYKKDTGKKVGCTKGSIKKYLAALHAGEARSKKKKSKKKKTEGIEVSEGPIKLSEIAKQIMS